MANKYNCKLTPELSAKLCEAIAKGHSILGACGYAGIHETTYYNWIHRGEKAKSGKYKEFYCDVEIAKAKATETVESVIIDSIPDNPKDAKWWLTKRRPETYGDRQYNETTIDATVESDITINLLDRVKEKRQELDDLTKD